MSVANPAWIEELFQDVICCITPDDDFKALFTFDTLQPFRRKHPWKVIIRPTFLELVGGPDDGRCYSPAFRVCLAALMSLFDDVHVDWAAVTCAKNSPERLDGISLDGYYKKHRLLLHICSHPLRNSAPRQRFNVHTKELTTI